MRLRRRDQRIRDLEDRVAELELLIREQAEPVSAPAWKQGS
ncbi:MAG: hypothetical protein U5R31_03030 [Acidimicrobiia bacterium]|nr:hypothetical protein [Acidimicrobiia bacterium]